MPLVPESKEEVLLKFLRGTPRSTQACRDHLNTEKRLTSAETETLLAGLRDEGAIAYANGEWYVVGSTRASVRKKPRKKPHPRQTDLFDGEAGHQYEWPSREARRWFSEWKAERR